MGRVKADGRGGYYWDANDTGPDQSGGTWAPQQGPVTAPVVATAPMPETPSFTPAPEAFTGDKYWGTQTPDEWKKVADFWTQRGVVGPGAPSPSPSAPSNMGGNHQAFGQAWLASGGRTPGDLLAFVNAHPEYGASVGGSKGDKVTIGGRIFDAVIAAGLGGQGGSWADITGGDGGGGGGGGGAGGGQNYAPFGGGTRAFSDPATSEWETLLRSLVTRLNTPQRTQDYSGITDYMRKYMQSLQDPAYTPAQSEIIQTQTLDPLTAQRDAQRQQIIQRFARQGMGPSSGPVQKALQDLDTQFQQLRTRTQGAFATNAINLDQQRAGQAAQVGLTLQNLEQGVLSNDEQRARDAVSQFYQIPQLADSRLSLANNVLGGSALNPVSLLGLQNSFQDTANRQSQFNTEQRNQYTDYLAQLIGSLFK